MWLAVDSGNTRVKWALMEGDSILARAAMVKTRLVLPRDEPYSAVWVSHVGSANDLRRLQKALAGKRPVHFIKSRRTAAGVSNPYQPPSALGVDRWLCLLAARQLQASRQQGVVVVSAGTAVTVDILLPSGWFAGGLILPGLALMPAALSSKTPLPLVRQKEEAGGKTPPQDTAGAIALGALLAVVGAVQAARRRYAPGARLLLTGGDATRLQPYLPRARLLPDLIFHGMACLPGDRGDSA